MTEELTHGDVLTALDNVYQPVAGVVQGKSLHDDDRERLGNAMTNRDLLYRKLCSIDNRHVVVQTSLNQIKALLEAIALMGVLADDAAPGATQAGVHTIRLELQDSLDSKLQHALNVIEELI